MWQPYRQTYGFQSDPGIVQFNIADPESISVEYQKGKRYQFSNALHGSQHVAKMKELAQLKKGLTQYIKDNKLKGEKLPDKPS